MVVNLKFHDLVALLLFTGSCFGDPVELTCQYVEKPAGILPYIANIRYECNLVDEAFAVDSQASDILGDHIEGKSDSNVEVLSIDGKEFYKIPDLSATFNGILYINIQNTPMQYLKNSDLIPYAAKLIYLVIKKSKLEILENNLLNGLSVLKTLDLRENEIFYIYPDIFDRFTFSNLLLDGNQCNNLGTDIGHFDRNVESLLEFIKKVKSSTCGTLDPVTFVSTYLTTKADYDLSLSTIAKQAEEMITLQNSFDSVNASLTNVTDLYNEANLTISTLESQISTLNSSIEDWIGKLDDANSTIFTLNSTISNLTIDIEELALKYEDANLTISSLESTIESLNSSSEQWKISYGNLNQSFISLQLHTAELEAKVVDLDMKAEKCLEVNGTCRFTTGINGYTCIAHDVNITSSTATAIEWTGTHNPGTFNNKNVLALIIRNLDVQYMPSTIGSTFVDIKTIIVQNCGLKKLSKDDFKDLAVLTTLEIASNNIESIDSGAFNGLPLLETLNLSENKIKFLPSQIFAMLPMLQSLSLDKNELTSIKADYLATTNSIKYFSAVDNQLSIVESSFVWKLRSAALIDFSGNECNQVFNITSGISYITFYSAILSRC